MDLKRHVQDLRENIITNWTTTGQELSRELKQFWPASRPQSPARFNSAGSDVARSPTSLTSGPGNSKEFVTGYALGLVGGVRSWVSTESLQPLTIITDLQRSHPSADDQEPENGRGQQPTPQRRRGV